MMKMSELENGIRHTVVTFDPFLMREDICSASDKKIAERFHIPVSVVKDMRAHRPVPFETIQQICHELRCQPGDILEAVEGLYFPASKTKWNK